MAGRQDPTLALTCTQTENRRLSGDKVFSSPQPPLSRSPRADAGLVLGDRKQGGDPACVQLAGCEGTEVGLT